MSTQSGIVADQNLLDSLSSTNGISNTDELIIVTARISDDSTAVQFHKGYRSLKETVESLTSEPLYVFIQGILDDPSQFYFVSYVPDTSPVRSKMLYASTKNTLIRQIGTNSIGKQALLTEASDLYDLVKDKDNQTASALTESERADIEISQQQQKMRLATHYPGGRKLVSQTDGTPKSLAFHVSSGGSSVADLLKDYNVLSFKIDMANEQIEVASKDKINSPHDLKITKDHPSYVIYKNGSMYYFIYSCPSGSKVKDRMVYASNRSGFITHLQDEEQLNFAKILEIGEPEELEVSLISISSEEEQAQEDAKSQLVSETKFHRPRGPTRKRRV